MVYYPNDQEESSLIYKIFHLLVSPGDQCYNCGIIVPEDRYMSSVMSAVGKRFRAITRGAWQITPLHNQPNVGVVSFPIKEQTVLPRCIIPKITPAVIEFIARRTCQRRVKGRGLGNKFLSHIREMDAIIHVVRCFETTIIHVYGSDNPSATSKR